MTNLWAVYGKMVARRNHVAGAYVYMKELSEWLRGRTPRRCKVRRWLRETAGAHVCV